MDWIVTAAKKGSQQIRPRVSHVSVHDKEALASGLFYMARQDRHHHDSDRREP